MWHPTPKLLVAWSVHLLTAGGAVVGLCALSAASRGEFREALLWMYLAVAIDAVDGPLARRLEVAATVPGIDGSLLDNVVDYLNYAVVPAFFVQRLGLAPQGWGLVGPAAICLAAAFQFSHVDAKRDGQAFRGFPSYWNVLAFWFLMLEPPGWVALACIGALGALSLVPVDFVYPTRTPRRRAATAAVLALFAVCAAVALVRYPAPSPLALGGTFLAAAAYAGLSAALTLELRGR